MEKKKKVLFCASTASHIKNFHLPYLKFFKEEGWIVHAAVEEDGAIPYADRVVGVGFSKRMFAFQNLRCLWRLRKLLKEERYDVISLHTALAAALARAALLLARKGKSRVCYVVHGYLFSEDTPFLKKLPYLLPELLLRKSCDVVAAMNEEDARLAEKYHLYRGRLIEIKGMGLPEKIKPGASKEELRRELGLPQKGVVLLCGAEFSRRKNQAGLLRLMLPLFAQYKEMTLVLAGEGATKPECMEMARGFPVLFPGHVANLNEYMAASDLYLSASRSEGLPFHILEAMELGLPLLVSRVKGHTDLLAEGEGGYLFSLRDADEFAHKLSELLKNPALRLAMGENNKEKAKPFSLSRAGPGIEEMYRQLL